MEQIDFDREGAQASVNYLWKKKLTLDQRKSITRAVRDVNAAWSQLENALDSLEWEIYQTAEEIEEE
jgi:hypothetical protein